LWASLTPKKDCDRTRVLEQAPAPGHDASRSGPRGLGGTEGHRTATGDMMELAPQQKAKSAAKRPRNRYADVT